VYFLLHCLLRGEPKELVILIFSWPRVAAAVSSWHWPVALLPRPCEHSIYFCLVRGWLQVLLKLPLIALLFVSTRVSYKPKVYYNNMLASLPLVFFCAIFELPSAQAGI